jgi:enoyl-CoA hydratase/carnithine racemase/short-subunit dehydrogenase involved in D-alanine esterification of teichoic acids
MPAEVAGKVATVTGGSRGIGAACARAVASAGARVVITYSRSHEQAQAEVDVIRAKGGLAQAVCADQADPEQAAQLIRRVAEEWGRLDILVNNAAVAVVGPIGQSSPQFDLDRQLTVNYVSIVAAIRAAAPLMTDGGRIINIGSGPATLSGSARPRRSPLASYSSRAPRRQIQQTILDHDSPTIDTKETDRMSPTPDYFKRYENFALTRSESGVLTLRFHTAGGPVTFTGTTHSDFPRLLEDIAFDRNNKVLVITGTGDRFMTEIDGASLGDITKPMASDITYMEGRRIPQRLADLEMPIIAAVNGPASVHSEYALIADIVIASETTEFSDFPHLTFGINPGDGLHIVWEEALGLNRARYYALTQGTFTAAEAKQWGAVAEVLPQDQVLTRAQELAESLAAKPQLLTRYAAVTLRQRISRRMAEGTALGMALESLTAANLAYLPQPQ